jgi:hypothetical protein
VEKICKNCHWFATDKDFSHVITCLDSFEKVEETDTCENFCKDGTYEPTGVWAELAEVVKAVSHEVKRRGSKD